FEFTKHFSKVGRVGLDLVGQVAEPFREVGQVERSTGAGHRSDQPSPARRMVAMAASKQAMMSVYVTFGLSLASPMPVPKRAIDACSRARRPGGSTAMPVTRVSAPLAHQRRARSSSGAHRTQSAGWPR